MQIYVDADACPVVDIVEKIAKKYQISVTLLCDTNHILTSGYSEVVVVGAGADAVDYKLISLCRRGDIVVTQDYGVAAMTLGKSAYAIHQSGKWYTDENIDQMLMERHLNKKARRASHKNHLKGPKKRTEEDDERFAQSFERMVKAALEESEMILFPKKSEKKTYDRSNQKPVIKASICNGEQVAGFKDIHTGKFEEVMLIRRAEDLETFKTMYGIEEEIAKEY